MFDIRKIKTNELNQIYISSFFRTMAIGIVGIFVPIFLLDLGYSLYSIFFFYLIYSLVRSIFHLIAGQLISLVGPRRTIVLSLIAQLISSLSFLLLPTYPIPISLIASFWAIANALFFNAYHIDFSKVKHASTSGKEMGFADITQKLGGALGPITAGLVATTFGPQYIFLAMGAVLMISIVPMLIGPDPTKNEKMTFELSPSLFRQAKQDLISYAGFTVSHQISASLWPLFLGVYILGSEMYLELGALSSFGVFVSMLTAYIVGRSIDKNKRRRQLRISAIIDASAQFMKVFVNSIYFAFTINTVGESSASALRIAYQKGMYHSADTNTSNRVAYITVMEAFSALIKTIIWIGLFVAAFFFGFEVAFAIGFIVAGLASMLTLVEKFPSLSK